MTKQIVILNQKGGVGKTTITTNLGYGLSLKGYKCLLIDCDAQANLSRIYFPREKKIEIALQDILLDKKINLPDGIVQAQVNGNPVENLYLIPSTQELTSATELVSSRSHREKLLSRQLEKISGEYDFIFMDCSPTINVISKNAMYVADIFIIPADMGVNSLNGIGTLFGEIIDVREGKPYDYRVIRNMVKTAAGKSVRYIVEELRVIEDNVFKSFIRQIEKINQANMSMAPVMLHEPKGPASDDYNNFIGEFLEIYGK